VNKESALEIDGASATGGEYRHVYVHVPFCARRCSYCDFAIAVRRTTPVDEYVASLRGELELRFGDAEQRGVIDTLYLGGGTPSRLGPDGVAAVVSEIRRHFDLSTGAEVTVEANPENLDEATVTRWRDAGVNRVSLGVQSFDPSVLTWMHRTHDVAAVHAAANALRDAGISNWSLDLIYALPPEVERDWSRDLSAALALAPPHISSYGLTIEGGTPLARWRSRGEVHDADEERFEAEFLEAHDRLGEAGYLHYEVSNWGLAGRESRHNSSYWRHVPYLGIGPGAHGFDGRVRRWNEREYSSWKSRVLDGREDPLGGEEELSEKERALESVYVGLRTCSGIVVLPGDASVIDRWVNQGWGAIDGDRLRLTPRGWLRLDALVAALTEHRSRY
jgi:oxygen-independent coproporphyrinogen-3 oxidase